MSSSATSGVVPNAAWSAWTIQPCVLKGSMWLQVEDEGVRVKLGASLEEGGLELMVVGPKPRHKACILSWSSDWASLLQKMSLGCVPALPLIHAEARGKVL